MQPMKGLNSWSWRKRENEKLPASHYVSAASPSPLLPLAARLILPNRAGATHDRIRRSPIATHHPHRIRQHGQNASPRRPLLRRANRPLPHSLRHRQRHHAPRINPRLRHPQKSRCPRQSRPRQTGHRKNQAHLHRRRRSHLRQTARPLPSPHLANRQRHANQHERQRSHLQPRHPAFRRRNGQQKTHPPQRRRQHVAILQRHVPRRHAHRRRHGNRPPPPSSDQRSTRRARSQAQGILGHRKNRPHPPAGRHPAHRRPGILRLGQPPRPRRRPCSRSPRRP